MRQLGISTAGSLQVVHQSTSARQLTSCFASGCFDNHGRALRNFFAILDRRPTYRKHAVCGGASMRTYLCRSVDPGTDEKKTENTSAPPAKYIGCHPHARANTPACTSGSQPVSRHLSYVARRPFRYIRPTLRRTLRGGLSRHVAKTRFNRRMAINLQRRRSTRQSRVDSSSRSRRAS
jgi:hypothetical protein